LRGFFYVERGAIKPLWIVTELPEPAIAAEAQNSTNATREVIVIDVFGRRPVADQAHVALLSNQLLDLGRANAVATLEVIVAGASVQTLSRLVASRVMAGFAIGRNATLCSPVARKL
jgi:hypothetical protein